MLVFLDFEASSLAKRSYPIEVGWVFEDGLGAEYLIRPAPDWTDWDEEAAAVHGIRREDLENATPHETVARIMVDQLSGHELLAQRETVERILAPVLPPGALAEETANLLALAEIREIAAPPAHRALADAHAERARWCAVRDAAYARVAQLTGHAH